MTTDCVNKGGSSDLGRGVTGVAALDVCVYRVGELERESGREGAPSAFPIVFNVKVFTTVDGLPRSHQLPEYTLSHISILSF